jgi:hypothetical protein
VQPTPGFTLRSKLPGVNRVSNYPLYILALRISLAISYTIKLYFYDNNLDENRSEIFSEKINTIFKKVRPAVFELKLTDSQAVV